MDDLEQEILHGPAATPPPGKTSNLVDPSNMHTSGVVLICVCIIVPTIFVAIRFYTKMFLIRKLMPSDYLMALAWALAVSFTTIAYRLNQVNPGLDQWNITVQNFIHMLKWFYILFIMYALTSWAIKATLLIQLVEMFTHRRNRFYWFCYILLGILSIFYIIITFTMIFACSPIHSYWDILTPGKKCLDTEGLNVSTSAINSASDLIILLLPQFQVWQLNMDGRKRLVVIVVFMMGIIAIACSLVRLAYAVQMVESSNTSYYSYMSGFWCFPEVAAGIVVGCFPTLPRFIHHLKLKYRGLISRPLVQHVLGKVHMANNAYQQTGDKGVPDSESSRNNPKPDVSVDLYPLTSYASNPPVEVPTPPDIEMIYNMQLSRVPVLDRRYDQQRAVRNTSGRH